MDASERLDQVPAKGAGARQLGPLECDAANHNVEDEDCGGARDEDIVGAGVGGLDGLEGVQARGHGGQDGDYGLCTPT